jgi:CPA2 family monovalent cation:H+ antiporter-2
VDHAHEFLKNLALVLGVAGVTTIVFQRLRQPVVFGYLVAGLILGPHVPIPLVADLPTIQTLSELGVILLMFSLGLEFSLRRLLRVGPAAGIVALLQCTWMLWLGYQAGQLMGWGVLERIYAGAAIAISSTTIVVKAFADERVRGRVTELVFGILIVEDLIAIVLLAVLTPASTGGGLATGSVALELVRLVGVLAAMVLVGMLLVPRLVRAVVKLGRNETTLVACVGLCFAAALLGKQAGYSVALGAFLAGSFVAESGKEKLVARLIEPVRDMFAAIFFVSVGMMIDPGVVARHWAAVLGFTALVVLGMTSSVAVSAFLTGSGTRTAVQAGMSLAQIGEFSFIIAAAGLASGATSPALYPIIVGVSALTTLLTPWLIRSAGPVAAAIDRNLPRPLQTFVTLYDTWFESIRTRPATSAENARLWRLARGLLVDAVIVLAVAIGTSVALAPLGHRVATWTGLGSPAAQGLVVAVAVGLSIPFLVGILRTGRGLGQALSRRAFPDPEQGRLDMAAAPRRALVVTVQLATVLIVGAPLVTLTQPFVAAPYGPVVLAAALVVLGMLVWRTAADLQGHVRAAAEAFVDALGRYSGSGGRHEAERALERARQLLPGFGEPFALAIEPGSPVVGRPLSELELRGRTGATIVAISRGEDDLLVPDGHVVLRGGDVVALVGTHAAIESARQLLAGEVRE